jgi:hypothetical protein
MEPCGSLGRFYKSEFRLASHRASALNFLIGPNHDGKQSCDGAAAVVPAVAGTVLHDNITWLERDVGPVIEFEACAHAVLNRTHVPRKKRYDQRNAPRSAEPPVRIELLYRHWSEDRL